MRLSQQRIELKSSLRRRGHQGQGGIGKDRSGLVRTGNFLGSGRIRLSQPRIGKGERGILGNGSARTSSLPAAREKCFFHRPGRAPSDTARMLPDSRCSDAGPYPTAMMGGSVGLTFAVRTGFNPAKPASSALGVRENPT